MGYRARFRGNVSAEVGGMWGGRRERGAGLWLVREGVEPELEADEVADPAANPAATPDSAGTLDAAAAEADHLLELADEIVVLSANIQAATARLLELVAEFDRLEGWRAEGHRTCAHWLAHHTGLDLGAAREKVRVARALGDLPLVSERFGRGEVSYAKVRALTRVASPGTESDLLAYAEGASAAGVERLVRSWREHDALDEASLERERHRSRRLSVVPDHDGMYVVRGRLDPEAGDILLRALETAEDALFERDRARALAELEPRIVEELGGRLTAEARALVDPLGEIEPRMTSAQRKADALGLVAEQALARGFPPECGGGARRREVVLHVDRRTLESEGTAGAEGKGGNAENEGTTATADAEGNEGTAGTAATAATAAAVEGKATLGISELEDGTRVSAEVSRRLTCDATVRTMTHDGRDSRLGPTVAALGPALDVGRRRRTVPPALRRALEVRDGGCRFPGCGSRFTDGHHIIHWADGGPTALNNLVLLCLRHHRLVHHEGFRVRMDAGGQPRFATPSGIPLPEVPLYDVRGRVDALLAANRAGGVVPDFRTGRTRWRTLDDVPLDVRERVG